MNVDYRKPGVTWPEEAKSKVRAYKFAAACGRLGVAAFPVRNEDGTWRVEMTA